MIIGISGLIGAGKDTVADYFVNHHDFRRESWAGTLKDAVAVVFGWDRVMLEGKTRSSREWREQPDAWWSERLGMQVTPRNVLQQWGTDVCRKSYHDAIWIASLENKIRRTTDDIVISDCRFANEIVSIKNLGGLTIRVKRGSDPAWAELYRSNIDKFKLEYPDIHASEYSSIGLAYDYVIENNDTIDALHGKLSDLLQYHRSSK